MIDRRTFLKTTGAATMLWAGRGIPAAAADGSRVALVVGNNAYHQAPLGNPVNDATAISNLLRQANFEVDLRTDTTRDGFLASIDAFAEAVARRRTELGLFYFAGHGAQLAWKNYLLPVDATIASPDDLTRRCVELNQLLARMGETSGKTFVVILDACRNDPFAGAWRAEQQGLSQFDAPVGSLLAYATAPGSVASDGAGQNGLYTGHLLKELAAPQTSIEDALKRVRLNVRLDSRGAQIPWESTSLEERVVLFPSRNGSEAAELERQFEEELAIWNTIQASRDIDEWVIYLRRYPTGRFSEIAQVRLNRLLAEREKTLAVASPMRPEPIATAQPAAATLPVAGALPTVLPNAASTSAKPDSAATPAPALDTPVTPVAASSVNPYSAGIHPIGRDYKPGDRISYRHSDLLTGVVERDIELVVTRVDPAVDRVEFNDGIWVSDLNGNLQKMGRNEFDLPVQIFPAELQIGKRWRTRFRIPRRNFEYDLELRIRVREKVTVPAGEFDAFKIEGLGWGNEGQRMDAVYWVVPGINPFYVKRELKIQAGRGRLIRTERHDLIAFKQ